MLDDGAPVHLGNGWYRYEDDAAAHYYYNTISEVTQWDAPTAEQCAEPEWDHDDGGAAGEGAGQGTVGETDTLTAYFTHEPAQADEAGVPTSRREPVRAGRARQPYIHIPCGCTGRVVRVHNGMHGPCPWRPAATSACKRVFAPRDAPPQLGTETGVCVRPPQRPLLCATGSVRAVHTPAPRVASRP
jgi:hypothetical protein